MNRSDIILYFDCLSGISGDMTVGAFLGLGISIDYLTEELKKLGLEGYSISFSQVKRHSLLANKFKVEVNPSQPIRGYGDIVKLISESSLRENVKDISLKIFEEIAKAEAIVHCQDIDDVHFHEVGAVDTIVDVVSTAICIDKINPDTIVSSPIPLGRGNTKTHHGTIPVPAPATLEILKGLPVYGGDFDFEVTTPTGAAIVKTLVKDFCAMPLMEVEKIGVGAGDVDTKEVPNLLRIIKGRIIIDDRIINKLGASTAAKATAIATPTSTVSTELGCEEDTLILLSTNIDDSSPELIAYLFERLKPDALDVWIEPIYMKKNRPAFKVCALCRPEKECRIVEIIFRESTTFGVRREEVKRYTLSRQSRKIKLPYGEVEVKVGMLKGKEIILSPEFESVKKLAERLKKPLKEVYQDTIFLLSKT